MESISLPARTFKGWNEFSFVYLNIYIYLPIIRKKISKYYMDEQIKTSEIIAKYRGIYEGLKPIYSPAIGEKVYFNMPGFKHLIFKGKHRRQTKAILNRLVLIPLIAPVIINCKEETEIRIRKENIDGKKIRVTYYALEAHVGKDSVRVRVITRKVGEKGKHYFQSIMKY